MTTDQMYQILMKKKRQGKTLAVSAASAGMSENTARKYFRLKRAPSQCRKDRTWRTRQDPFAEVWDEIRSMLEESEGAFEAKTLFEHLQRCYPGTFSDGQLRTLQRRVKQWRALEGEGKEIYFPQEHEPGEQCQSDFTDMGSLGITIAGRRFDHLLYHFVLTYSNWETGTLCFSESFESLCLGLQNALWELGGVPRLHQSDRMSAAVHNLSPTKEFTRRYEGLMRHYRMEGRKIQAGKANEDGDVEQRHYRFKKTLGQELLLRGSRDFGSQQELEAFYRSLFDRLNIGRREKIERELKTLRPLPLRRLEDYTPYRMRVSPASTINVQKNIYSVHSRLRDEVVTVRVYADHLEIWYAQKKVEAVARLRGAGKHAINYRHVIGWLVRKPGAFAHYRYRGDLFPSSYFRMAYDDLRARTPRWSDKQYLKILELAALESESRTEEAIVALLDQGRPITYDSVAALVNSPKDLAVRTAGHVDEVDLDLYDRLLETEVG